MSEPALCTLNELKNGTYTLSDLFDFNEALDLREHINFASTRKSQKKNETNDLRKKYNSLISGGSE